MGDVTPDETIRVGERNVALKVATMQVGSAMTDGLGPYRYTSEVPALFSALCREARAAARLREGIDAVLVNVNKEFGCYTERGEIFPMVLRALTALANGEPDAFLDPNYDADPQEGNPDV